MNWIKFAFWLLGIYTFYYGGIIFWDYLRNNRSPAESNRHELTFVEDIEPQVSYSDELSMNDVESPVTFSGGVSLKQLFNLAREESVEYIKSVSY